MSFQKYYDALTSDEMDFVGQKNAYDLQSMLIYGFSTLGFLYGFWEQSFIYCFYATLIGCALATVACLPSWPWYMQDPLKWQPAADRERYSYDNDEEYFGEVNATSSSKKDN
ncbi:unnamed protein product [Amoebophrya sp. A120]|nr:unnamed protein product [Amoebophrya sp. A120]|eukprot:GSA120T00010198001.1